MNIETFEQDMTNMLVEDFTQEELEYMYVLFFCGSNSPADTIIRKLVGAENIRILVRAIDAKRTATITRDYPDNEEVSAILFGQEFARFQAEMDALSDEEPVGNDDYGVIVDYEGHDYQGRGW
jgi:hypothetical protein